MTPLHGIACFYDVGFGARAVSRKTPIFFIIVTSVMKQILVLRVQLSNKFTIKFTISVEGNSSY